LVSSLRSDPYQQRKTGLELEREWGISAAAFPA